MTYMNSSVLVHPDGEIGSFHRSWVVEVGALYIELERLGFGGLDLRNVRKSADVTFDEVDALGVHATNISTNEEESLGLVLHSVVRSGDSSERLVPGAEQKGQRLKIA